jgi:hypothetical protein
VILYYTFLPIKLVIPALPAAMAASAARAPTIDQVNFDIKDLKYDVNRLSHQRQMKEKTSAEVFSEMERLLAREGNIYQVSVLEIIAYNKLEDENKKAALLAALRISSSCIWAGKKAVAEAAKAGKKAVAEAATTTAADPKKTLDELYADIQVSETSRDFLSEVYRLVQELGLERFLGIYAQEPWGFQKVLREVAEGFQAGTFVLPPVLREGKATFPVGTYDKYVLEAIFHHDTREYISNPPLWRLMPPPSNKHMGVFSKFVNDCLGKGKVISTAMFASLYWFLKMQYCSDAAHEAFTTAAGSEFLDPIVIGLLLSGSFPDTQEKVKSLLEAVVQQLNLQITPQDDYYQEKGDLLEYFQKYYDARKDIFWTEETGFNQTFLELLASLMTMFEIFARCEDNYIGCWVGYFEENIAKRIEKFSSNNGCLPKQMDDLRSRIIYLFEDDSSRGEVVNLVSPKYPSCMA